MFSRVPLMRAGLFGIAMAISNIAAALECPELKRAATEIDAGGFANGLLWQVESSAGQQSYLFGTIHISDPRVTNLNPVIRAALADSKHFMMEVMLDLDTVQRMSLAMYYPGDELLSTQLPPEIFGRTVDLLARYGVSPEAAEKLKPWAAYTTLSLPPGQTDLPLDLELMHEAKQTGKTVAGLETLDEQIAVFDGLGGSEQIELLQVTVCHYDRFQGEVEEMIAHYENRDLAAMMRMAVRYESPLQDRFMDLLLRQRNHRMVERMRARLDGGGAFIAIGALHLPGREGVLRLLRAAGYRITKIF